MVHQSNLPPRPSSAIAPVLRRPSESESSSQSAEEDDYSDVDFWGGESPRLLSTSPPERLGDAMALNTDNESDTEDELDDEDDADEENELDNEEDEAEEEAHFLDQLDIPGHR